jgi:hypothetical protein
LQSIEQSASWQLLGSKAKSTSPDAPPATMLINGRRTDHSKKPAMRYCLHACVLLIAPVLLAVGLCQPAKAAPPAYLLLRRAESPGNRYHPGYYDAAMYDARTSGYAYGFFGAPPRSHASRHFGFYRTYTQWSVW